MTVQEEIINWKINVLKTIRSSNFDVDKTILTGKKYLVEIKKLRRLELEKSVYQILMQCYWIIDNYKTAIKLGSEYFERNIDAYDRTMNKYYIKSLICLGKADEAESKFKKYIVTVDSVDAEFYNIRLEIDRLRKEQEKKEERKKAKVAKEALKTEVIQEGSIVSVKEESEYITAYEIMKSEIIELIISGKKKTAIFLLSKVIENFPDQIAFKLLYVETLTLLKDDNAFKEIVAMLECKEYDEEQIEKLNKLKAFVSQIYFSKNLESDLNCQQNFSNTVQELILYK